MENLETWIIEQRRALHQIPETAHTEQSTRKYIAARLDELGISHTTATGKDVIGAITGTRPGPTVVVRSDMDGLAIVEETDLDFASTNGAMHACGHDGHMSIVLGVAKLFSEDRDFPGEIRFLFQHAEEAMPGGAREVVEAGAMDDVDAIIGCHLWQPVSTGLIGVSSGAVMAGCDGFEIELFGRGGHGSTPDLTTDPTLMAAHFITQVHTIISRSIHPSHNAVLSIGKVEAGKTYNVIPEQASLTGTVRHFDITVSQLIERRMHEILTGITQSFGGGYRLTYTYGEPPLVNDPHIVSVVESAATEIIGEERVQPISAVFASEDFTYYAERVPAAFMFVGVGSTTRTAGHHTPQFDIAEEVLEPTARVLHLAAIDLLSRTEQISSPSLVSSATERP